MFKHITWEDRLYIEKRLRHKAPVSEIASELGKSRKSIYAEIKKGLVTVYGYYYEQKIEYSADKAQQVTDYRATAHGRPLKIGSDRKTANYIEHLIKHGYSPYAVSVKLREDGYTQLSCSTIYNYIFHGIFFTVTEKDMIYGKRVNTHSAVTRRNKCAYGTSIENRPAEVSLREDMGHWEMDTVQSCKGKRHCLLVLTERRARLEVSVKVKDKTAIETYKALKRLRQSYGDMWCKLFKTITVDNGGEFACAEEIEKLGVKMYYCHPYTVSERGSNENQNRFIRRYFPKGTDFGRVTNKALQDRIDFINNYPRRIFGGCSSAQVMEACINSL